MPETIRFRARKILGVWFCARRKLRENGAGFEDLFRKPAVLGRIDDVWSGAEDGDRAAARFKRGAVGRGVHAASQPRDDGNTGLSQLGGDSFGDLPSIGSRPARTDDRDRCVVGGSSSPRT